jgi:sortase (surface protein transpeptidase)
MDRTRTDRIVHWVERGLVAMGAVCLIWVSANLARAVAYQVEQHARLARVGSTNEQRVADPARVGVVARPEGPVPLGRLEIPRIGLSAVVMEGDEGNTLKVAVGHLPDTPLPLTLICYPFDFVGPAPRRFVVDAERLVETAAAPLTAARDQGGRVR